LEGITWYREVGMEGTSIPNTREIVEPKERRGKSRSARDLRARRRMVQDGLKGFIRMMLTEVRCSSRCKVWYVSSNKIFPVIQ
jgi:hypothetical protein